MGVSKARGSQGGDFDDIIVVALGVHDCLSFEHCSDRISLILGLFVLVPGLQGHSFFVFFLFLPQIKVYSAFKIKGLDFPYGEKDLLFYCGLMFHHKMDHV